MIDPDRSSAREGVPIRPPHGHAASLSSRLGLDLRPGPHRARRHVTSVVGGRRGAARLPAPVVVDAGPRLHRGRALHRPPRVPPQRAHVLARRRAVRARTDLRERQRPSLGALVGTVVVYGALRRLPPVKLAFNVASCGSRSTSRSASSRRSRRRGGLGPDTWAGVYAATLVTGALTIAASSGAIAITEGGMSLDAAPDVRHGRLVTLTNSSIAIAAAILVSTDPRAVPVLLVPALTVFVAYRAYVSERQRHEQLEFLYEANRTLSRSPEVAEAIEGLLARSLEAFRSEVAEVVLFSADGTPAAHHLRARRRARDDGASPPTPRSRRSSPRSSTPTARSSRSRRRRPPRLRRPPRARAASATRWSRCCRARSRMIGTIMLANRFGIERGYGAEDLRLLEALANNASVALQYDRLEQAVDPAARAPGAAAPPGLPRPAHRPAQPLAVHGAGARGARRRRRRPLGRAVHRRRRLQDRQRLARPRRRRRAAGLGRRPAARLRAPAGRRRAPRRRRVRGHAARRRATRASRAAVGHADPRGVRRCRCTPATSSSSVHLSVGIAAQPRGRRRRRRADPRRRPGDVPGQVARARAASSSSSRRWPPRCCAATTSRRSSRKAVERERDRRRVPADRRARAPAASPPPRRSCAGSTRCAGGVSPVASSSRWPRRPA